MKSKEEFSGLLSGRRRGICFKELRFGTWNLRSLYRSKGLSALTELMECYRIDLLALQEMRWTGNGIQDGKTHTVFYSCDPRKHVFGTGFVISKKIRHLVIDFEAKSPRLCKIRLKGKFFNYSIINIHAPTEDKEEDEKDTFYEQIHALYTSSPKHDIKIVLGDANAKIGKEDMFRPTIGGHSLHCNSNDNGQRLVYFAMEHDMVISSTCFMHKRIHKMTWRSPDFDTFNQIDHVLIDARHASDVLDVRSYRGANFDSDHYLIIMKIRARISNVRKKQGSKSERFNCQLLKETNIKELYRNELENRLDNIQLEIVERTDEKWNLLKAAIIETGNTVVGKITKIKRNDWFDQDCRVATELKNKAYMKMLERKHTRSAVDNYKFARKNEKKIHRSKKRVFHENLLKDVEHLRGAKESRAFFHEVNRGRRTFKPRATLCRAKDGSILSDKQDILHRWREHLDELLNQDSQLEVCNSTNRNQDYIYPPTLEEVKNAIKRLKNNKSPGIDNIPSEFLKAAGPNCVQLIKDLVQHIWDTETLPTDWKLSTICMIHKKGDVLDCSNYRGISLLCTTYKVLSTILFDRLLPHVDTVIGDYQCGFRRGRSTTEQIFNLRQIFEKCREYKIDTHNLFIDFKTAYDCIDREQLIAALYELNIPEKLVGLVAMTLKETKIQVRVEGAFSEELDVKNGLRQGDALACLLFNVALEKVLRDSNVNIRGNIFTKSIQVLAYADDICIVSRTLPALKQAFLALEQSARKFNLSINEMKTKYLPCLHCNSQLTYLEVGGYKFEKVSSFTYLGAEMNDKNALHPEIQKRISAANRCFHSLRSYLRSNFLKLKTKLLLYKTLIRSVLTYASETWALTLRDEAALCIFERKVLRCILGGIQENGSWRRRFNLELYRAFKEPDVVKFIKLQRLKWAGHLARMSDDSSSKKIFLTKPFGTRPRGRPPLRWIDCVEKDFKTLRVTNWKTVAKSRSSWRRILEKARAHAGLSSQ